MTDGEGGLFALIEARACCLLHFRLLYHLSRCDNTSRTGRGFDAFADRQEGNLLDIIHIIAPHRGRDREG